MSSNSGRRSSTRSAAGCSRNSSASAAHKHDPLYKIRGLLRHGLEHVSERQHAQLRAGLLAGGPHCKVELAWSCYQQLRSTYAGSANLRDARALAEKVTTSFLACPIPEVARLDRTLRAWR